MARLIASFFGTGLILDKVRHSDMGSGTVGSAFALAPALAMHPLGVAAQAAALVVILAAGLAAVQPFARDNSDPGWIVVDEAAGTFLATLGLGVWAAIVAWVVFRLADIQKHWFPGVAAAERLPGAAGVMADDLVAGAYGLLVGILVTVLFG
ncbi:MAG: phosphatidylglycerophosphatase A [Acidimicrobiia bacterium]